MTKKKPPRSLRIAVVTSIDVTPKILLYSQLRHVADAGHHVSIFCSNGPNRSWLVDRGFSVFPVEIKRKISPFRDVAALWRLYRHFRANGFDVVHTHTPKPSLLGQLAARLAGVPIIVNTIHGFYFHEHMNPISRCFYVAVEWIAARCSTVILSQNPEDIDAAIRFGITRPEKIHFLGNGVDLGKFNPERFDEAARSTMRREFGIPKNAVVVGIIGRLVREKGYMELFEAMKHIMRENEHVWLMIIGPEEPDKSDRISPDTPAEFGIADRTCCLGSRDDIPELLSTIDIYTLPSWREGFPRSAIEAACMGLPIVTTNIRGCRQVVTDGENGLLVAHRDANSLQKALTTLIVDPDLRRKMGDAGHARAQREFNEARICETVLETYSQAAEEAGL